MSNITDTELSNYWISWINNVKYNQDKYAQFYKIYKDKLIKSSYTFIELTNEWNEFENILNKNASLYSELYNKYRNKELKKNIINSNDYNNAVDKEFYASFYTNGRLNNANNNKILKEEQVVKCINDKCSRVFKSGEYCTIDTAVKYGLNDLKKPENVFDKNIINDEKYIDKYINNIIDSKKQYSICNLKNGIAYTNCALVAKSPWFTLNENNTKCRIPSDLKLPGGFSLNGNILKKPEEVDIRKYGDLHGYCQEKWFDWFTIPDYHIGNVYMAKKRDPKIIENDPSASKNDIDRCFKPCEIGTVPYNNSDYENINKCINRDDFANGMFKNTSYYMPLAFINLIGNTNNDLKDYYKNILLNTSNIIVQNDYKELKSNVIDFISNTNNICDNIVNEAIIERSISIDKFITKTGRGFTHINVIEPDTNLKNILNPNTSLFKLEHSYKICKKFYDALEKKLKDNDDKEYNEIVDNIKDIINLKNTNAKNITDFNEIYEILFKIFKKASNLCFSGETDYSNNYIFYTLNTAKGSNLTGTKYTPFKFNLDFNKPDKTIITDKDIKLKTATENIKKVVDNNSCKVPSNRNGSSDSSDANFFDTNIKNTESSECPQSKYEWPDPISYITTFIYMFLIFFVLYIIFILSDIFGYYIISGFNIFAIYIKNILYGVSNVFKSKYEPSDYKVKTAKRNLANIVRRLSVVRNAINKH